MALTLDYRVPNLPMPMKQPSSMVCWATVATMMASWRDQQTHTLSGYINGLGEPWKTKLATDKGLTAAEAPQLLATMGMQVETTQANFTAERWEQMLHDFGPLWVTADNNSKPDIQGIHAHILVGIHGPSDGDPTVDIIDPGVGAEVQMPMSAFVERYQQLANTHFAGLQIRHWPPNVQRAAQQSLQWAQQASQRMARASDVRASRYGTLTPMAASQSRYVYAQSPALVLGIEVADAIQIGLGAIAVVQSQVSASQGSFTLTYAQHQRLLTPDARRRMPGAQAAKRNYSRVLFDIGADGPLGIEFAKAMVIIEWEGNAYGEIGTPVIRRDLTSSTEWSRSTANLQILKLDRIPPSNTDPRAWPIIYTYEGTYDPAGNGYFEFTGEFEIDAFGGLRFNRHQVEPRSLADFAIAGSPYDYVRKGPDAIVEVPALPDEQLKFLRESSPG
jgi:hypothetical protein